MAKPSSSSPKSSVSSDGDSSLTAKTAATEVTTATEIIAAMKGSLGNLGKTFDSIGEQTTQMIKLGGELQTAQHINDLRKEMKVHDEKHEGQSQEIKALLQEVLQHDVVEHLRSLIESGVLDQIDDLVEEQVAQLIPQYISQELQDEVTEYKRQLEEAERALHNSESRRLNAKLRTSRLNEPLNTIYRTDGLISERFPKDLGELFSLDDETAQLLMEEYDLGEVSESRERNMNRFMQFCGISYQLMSSGPGLSSPAKIRMPIVIEGEYLADL